ncbi:hypothetical protein GGR03_004599 [Aurantimonas endophytica]|uniref:Uncharacterized protein n=1 Tax=Aurantimonas endophytica TaxID=1522175 RepID=A0A7W6HHV0_9HYPH|nr:hypothetical protein [Aurantimonas endophytica]
MAVVGAEGDSRFWGDVMLEIERRTGYRHSLTDMDER